MNLKTVLFDYFATGEGDTYEFIITNHNDAKRVFFELCNAKDDQTKAWYELGMTEYDDIPEWVHQYLSDNLIAGIREKSKYLVIELKFYVHKYL